MDVLIEYRPRNRSAHRLARVLLLVSCVWTCMALVWSSTWREREFLTDRFSDWCLVTAAETAMVGAIQLREMLRRRVGGVDDGCAPGNGSTQFWLCLFCALSALTSAVAAHRHYQIIPSLHSVRAHASGWPWFVLERDRLGTHFEFMSWHVVERRRHLVAAWALILGAGTLSWGAIWHASVLAAQHRIWKRMVRK